MADKHKTENVIEVEQHAEKKGLSEIREATQDVNDKQKRLIVDRRSLGQIALTKRRLTNNNDDLMS